MALQSVLGSLIFWPGWTKQNAGFLGLGTTDSIDAAGEYVAGVFMAAENMTVSHVGTLVATAAGSPTMEIRVETVDASTGLPSGTLWGTNTNATTSTLSTGWLLTALTASATINKNDVFAVVFKHASGTLIALNNAAHSNTAGNSSSLPYYIRNQGTPIKIASGGQPIMALGSSSTSFYRVPGAAPYVSGTTRTFSTSTGTAHGVRFKVPFSCRVMGLAFTRASSNGDFSAGIWDDGGSELSSSSTAFDGDRLAGSDGGQIICPFDNFVTLSPDTWYRAALWPSSTTSITLYSFDSNSTNYNIAMPGGANFHYTTRSSGGSWTDTATTTQPMIDIIIDQLDDGVGGGGGGGASFSGFVS